MAVKEKIRIRIKGYDHALVDQAAKKIGGGAWVKTTAAVRNEKK